MGRLGKKVSIFPESSQKRGVTMKLTNASIARFRLPSGKSDHIEFDDAMPGFGLRIRAGDKKEHRTFIAQYKIASKHRRINLGNVAKVDLDKARKEAKIIFGKVASGEDPANKKAEVRQAASHTLGSVIAKYLEAKEPALKASSYRETKRHLESHWKLLHGLALSSISRAHVAAQLGVLAKNSGPVATNRSRASLSTVFSWTIGEGLCDHNPVVGTNKQEEGGPRERSLSDAELAKVWLAAPENDYGRIVQLLMLTGCRREEIGSLKWPEIDTDARTITISPERTKNSREHVVHLCDNALAIIKRIPRRDREYVFGFGRGGFGGWSRSKAEIDKAAKLKDDWTLHDLRRTVRTGLGTLKVQPHIAEAVLNHLPPKLIRTYDRNTYAAEKKAALDLWASHLMVAVAQATGANVTAIHRRKV
jgi:integrase